MAPVKNLCKQRDRLFETQKISNREINKQDGRTGTRPGEPDVMLLVSDLSVDVRAGVLDASSMAEEQDELHGPQLCRPPRQAAAPSRPAETGPRRGTRSHRCP
jgi:hypothetical protein